MTLLSATPWWLLDIGRSLREAFFMFWETLWPLVLGFGLSGVVQAFVSRDAMQRKLGDHRPRTLLRASGYGMVSSSCSYAASAMSKSLFAKGADFLAAMVFMFASTNLVLELGIVLIVLMGWQFAASEFVGGVVMIVLLASVGGLWLRGRVIDEARQHLVEETHDSHVPEPVDTAHVALGERVRSRSSWADAATYTMADFTMLRREILLGYLVAGGLAVSVPTRAWNVLFLHGHGFWTSLENAFVGPFIAIISFVCSIGNVPLAAALWHGGIAFGGVVSFIFADLITFPLLMIYRRYYGGRVVWRLLTLFWLVMSVAGLVTEGLFRATGLVPRTHPAQVASASVSWNYTTYLNIVFLIVFAVLYYASKHQRAWGGGAGYAIDPVCGMQVQTQHAPASVVHDGATVYFCSDHCARRFAESPQRFLDKNHERTMSDEGTAIDPVCGMSVDPTTCAAALTHDEVNYYFCSRGCGERFAADPTRYLEGGPEGMGEPRPVALSLGRKPSVVTGAIDPVCGMSVDPTTCAAALTHDEVNYYFCSSECQERFRAHPSSVSP